MAQTSGQTLDFNAHLSVVKGANRQDSLSRRRFCRTGWQPVLLELHATQNAAGNLVLIGKYSVIRSIYQSLQAECKRDFTQKFSTATTKYSMAKEVKAYET
jgi:hypothetical protein